MMNNKLRLFAGTASHYLKTRGEQARKLYTDGIYPYPNHYYILKHAKSQANYRETNIEPEWLRNQWGYNCMTLFWTLFFFQLFDDPGAVLGHFTLPDPDKWTDEELGIPPPEAGLYSDWLAKKSQEMQNAKQS